jgi:hypothetical protein
LQQYRSLALDGDGGTAVGDGSVGVTAPGVAALSCFELAMTMDIACGDKLEIL